MKIGLHDTRRIYQSDFANSAIIISHDRWFLDRLCNTSWPFGGGSEVVWFGGNYQDYEADRKRRAVAEGRNADFPHRIRYKRLDA